MKMKRKMVKTAIAMLTLIAMVIETGFTSVPAYAAVLDTDDSVLLSNDANDEAVVDDGLLENDVLTEAADDIDDSSSSQIDITIPEEDIAAPEEDQAEPAEKAGDQNGKTLDVSDSGISGSGYDEIAIYIDTNNLDTNGSFKVKFVGADSAEYNPVLNDTLDKTNGGKYIFDELNGEGFSIRAISSDNAILSYNYNSDGNPVITVASKSADKSLGTRILTAVDNTKISAVAGEGYDSIKINFDTEDLTDKDAFKLYVESDADATVDGKSALGGLEGLTKSDTSLTIENLEGKSFVAYVVSDIEGQEISSLATVDSVEDGLATIKVDNVATKRIYEFEDSKIVVTAILEKADAIPDDAYFAVTPLTEEEAEKYLDALNEDKGEDDELATADNTLLYDIGFYTDETKSEEIEPEEGSVSISFEFKNDQLSEEIGAEAPEEIVVTHIKEEGSEVTTETVDADVSVEGGVVEFTTDSFSLYAITNIRGRILKTGESISYRDVLMGAVNYGLTANTIELANHIDSNFATSLLKTGTDNTTQGAYTGDKNPGNTIVADYEGSGWHIDSSNQKPFTVITTPEAYDKFKSNTWKSYVTFDTAHKKSELQGTVTNLVNGTLSGLFADNDARNKASAVARKGSDGKYVFDITQEAGGTYIIDFETGDVGSTANAQGKYFASASSTKIRLNSNQVIVFNVPDNTDLTLYKFGIEIADKNKSIESSTATEAADEFCQHVVWNFYNLKNGKNDKKTVSLEAVLGVFLAPSGTFRITGTSTGWAVADRIENGSGEWHCVWQQMPEPKKSKIKVPVNKKFIGGSGNWGEDGFTFKLERLWVSNGQSGVDNTMPAQYITLNGGDSEYATGEFELPEVTSDQINWTNQSWDYGCDKYYEQWYRISEVDQNGNAIGRQETGKPRNDVIYNIYNATEDLHGYPNQPYWYVHVFYYKNSGTNNIITVKRTARVLPTFNCYAGLPCIEDGTIEFVNKRIDIDVDVDFKGIKKINGSSNKVPDGKFAFTLYEFNDNVVFGKVLQTKENVGNTVTFDSIKLQYGKGYENKDNKSYFYFPIRETRCDSPYTKDDSVFIAKVILTKENNNTISKTVEYYKFADENSVDISKAINGDSSFKFTISKCDSAKFEFDNQYIATGNAVIYGFKMLEGRDMDPSDEFTFTLTSSDDTQQNANQTKTFKVSEVTSEGFEFEFDPLNYTLADDGKEYHYTVKETKGSDEKIIYDSSEKQVVVTVKDNKKGALIITQDDGTQNSRLKFVNKYKADGKIVFQAEKGYPEITRLSKDAVFTFYLKGGKKGEAATVNQQKSVKGPGTVTFDELTFVKNKTQDDTGVYTYQIWEDVPEDAQPYKDEQYKKIKDGIIYDTRVYNITLTVTDDKSGELKKAMTASFDAEPQKEVTDICPKFINDYDLQPVKDPIPGEKMYPGRILKKEMFTFKLETSDTDTKAAVKAGTVVLPADTTVKNGVPDTELTPSQFRFDDITFNAPGTYKFLVSEVIPSSTSSEFISDVEYSKAIFEVTKVVEDGGQGKLVISDSYQTLKDQDQKVKLIFTNTPVEPNTFAPIAYKDLTGRTLKPGQFTFELYDGTTKIDEASNDDLGYAYFNKITYTFAGLVDENGKPVNSKAYTYTIKEVIPEGAKENEDGTWSYQGYTYDGHTETISVLVTKEYDNDGKGSLKVESKNKFEDPAVFKNRYDAYGKTHIGGNKTLTGRKFTDADEGVWQAVMYDENGKEVQRVDIVKDNNWFDGYGGKFDFKDLEYTNKTVDYTQAVKYVYTIKEELNPEAKQPVNVKNDKTIYKAEITVTDDGEGNLVIPEPKYTDEKGNPVKALVFTNHYSDKDTVHFEARKEVNGTYLEGDMFTFELWNEDMTDLIDSKKNNDGGLVEFKDITYQQNDQVKDVRDEPYIYKIKENITNTKQGWSYDEQIYTVKVWVSLDANDEVKIDYAYFKDVNGVETQVDEAKVVFENTYTAKGEVAPWAEKKVTDREVPDGKFTFKLVDADNNVYTATNEYASVGKTAKAQFPTIEYTLDDLKAADVVALGNNEYVKYYTMYELLPNNVVYYNNNIAKADGWTYDTTEYMVEVHLTDNKKGKIETDWVAYKVGSTLDKLTLTERIKKFLKIDDVQKHALFTNKYDAVGALEITAKKSFIGKELKAGDFTFLLTGKDESGDVRIEKKNAADGTVDFGRFDYTKEGDYAYTVKEIVPKDAKEVQPGIWEKNGVKYDSTEYTLNVSVRDNKKGALDVTVTLNNAPVATVLTVATDGTGVVTFDPEVLIFTNTYSPAPVTVHPGGIKTLVGRDIEPAEFEFHMVSDSGNPKDYDEFTKNDGNIFTFPDIVFTEADMKEGKGYATEKEFWYTLTETKGNAKGVTYSEEEYKFVVKVTDIDGKLDAKVIRDDIYVKYQEVEQNKIAEFFNQYDAEGTFKVPVHKKVEGTDDKDKEFTFELYDEQEQSKEYVTLKADETKWFSPFDYKLANIGAGQSKVFKYTVKEVKPAVIPGGWDYCDDVYTVEVTVKDDKTGQLDVSHVYKVNGADYNEDILEFVNKYNATGSTPLVGKKVLENGDKLTGGEFSFILEQKTGMDADGKAVYSPVETVKNDANGNFSFTDLSFTMNDIGQTFEYRVRENIPDPKVEGMIYDETEYSVVIRVSDNKDGTLKVDKLVKDSKGNTVDDCIFRFKNVVVGPDQIVVTAHKTLEGTPLKPNMFQFTLKGDGGVDESIWNDGSDVTFSPIHYTLADAGKSFEYTVYEHGENPIKNIAYDKTQYVVKVDVKLVDNKLVIDRKNFKTDASGTTQVGDGDINFFNKYSAEVKVPLSGSKELSGFPADAPSIGKYTYQFGLYDSKGMLLQTKEVTPQDNKTPVAYAFDDLVFTEADYDTAANASNIFEYTVKEIVPIYEKDKAPNVEYAKNEYNVTVELYMTLDYELKARVSTKQNVATDKLNFTNIYKADGTEQFSVIKHITGKELEDAAYTFELTGEGQNQSKTNSGNLVVFDPIQYTANDLGVHTYTIKETAAKDGSTIDTRVYYGEVTVKEGTQNALDITKKVYMLDKDGTRIDIDPSKPIPFENTYEAKGEINLEGIKIMHSKPLAAGEFSFILKDENGNVIQTVTHAAASLNNKKDLEARAAFAFNAIKFTQEDLKAPNGGYLPQITKYYTVEEQIGNKGGVTYSHDAYVVEITVKDNLDKTLSVTKKVQGRKNVKKDKGGIAEFLKSLIGNMGDADDKIIFENEYDSECIIDPPILRKQMVGRDIVRGEFMFMIQGPGLRSMGEEEGGYVRYIQNGLNPVDKSIYYPNGEEIPEGELYVGDIKYKYIDLVDDESFSLETGAVSRTFVYTATEVNQEKEGIAYSDQKFELKVTCVENGDGTISVFNANGLLVNDDKNDKEHKLFWQPINPYKYNDEQMQDTFINTLPGEGSIDLVGTKKLEGRMLKDDDEFEFTLTDDATGKSVTRKNTKDEQGVPRIISFNSQDKDGVGGIDFLNYKIDMEDEGVSSNHVLRDDRGEHTYTITEKASNKAGIKYDTSTFKVYVDVQAEKDKNGKYVYNKNGTVKLDARITKIEKIYSDNNKVAFDFSNNCHFEFVNEFKATGKVEFTGSKRVNNQFGQDAGLAGSLKDKYSFAIYQYTDEARTQGKNLIDIKATDASGKFTLSVPDYDQDVLKNDKGEYEESKTLYYRIIETKPANGSWTENNTVFESEGIVYDNTEYDVDVTVAFDGTPDLKITKSIKKAATGQAINGIIFTNIESTEYTDVKGTKTWIDNVKDASSRPDVVVSLYSSAVDGGKKVINTYTIKAPALTYEFSTDAAGDPLPKYDSNGKTIKYTVTEAPIAGYLSEQKGYDFYNTKGTVKIQKIDADTNEPLAGASLAIYDGKTLVEKWTSGDSAHVVESVLTPGKTYTLRETAAPEGYELAGDISFTVPADGSDITVTMSDKPIIGSVRLTKLDSETRKTLSGAEFSLYTNEGTRIYATGTAGSYKVTSTTSNGVFATNSSGTLEITNLPKGTYYFVETKAPEGYVLSSEKIRFTISDSSKLVEVTFLNKESVAAVKLRKVGASGTRGLEGAKFELYAKTPRTSGQAISSTVFPDGYYRYGTYTTNSSGEIRVDDLPWDDYYFVETQAPDGYEISKDIGGETLVYTFKVDASNAGSTIDLGDVTNNPVETGVLGERVPMEEKVSGVLGVRSAPKKGVLGTRTGPATGDASAIALWLTLLVACIGTIIWMLASKKKRALRKQ